MQDSDVTGSATLNPQQHSKYGGYECSKVPAPYLHLSEDAYKTRMELRRTAARAVSNHHQLLFLPKRKRTQLPTWVLLEMATTFLQLRGCIANWEVVESFENAKARSERSFHA
jgi:hypothetical protein